MRSSLNTLSSLFCSLAIAWEQLVPPPSRDPFDVSRLVGPPKRTLKMLVLGSYDKTTKKIMRRLVARLHDIYGNPNLTAILAEDIQIFVSRSGKTAYALVKEV